MRSTWTDSRLDDFAAHTDKRFDTVDRRLEAIEKRITEVGAELSGRIDSFQHAIVLVGGGLLAACIGMLAAMIGLIATQL